MIMFFMQQIKEDEKNSLRFRDGKKTRREVEISLIGDLKSTLITEINVCIIFHPIHW